MLDQQCSKARPRSEASLREFWTTENEPKPGLLHRTGPDM
jgi:hypothetical protein